MPKVRTTRDYDGLVSEAEALWYDLDRWAGFVDDFHHVDKQEGEWPHPGSVVIWHSFPGGRGRVLERVTSYVPRDGQTLEIEDEDVTGTRRVRFAALPDGVRVELLVEYQLKDRSPGKRLADLFFIRRAFRDSLRRELARFGAELQSDRALHR
jgi:hypothetical protein